MAVTAEPRVALYFDFDNIVISRYDQLHGESSYRKDTSRTKTVAPDMVEAAARGSEIVLSPATKAYLDMKYDANTPLGLDWAGFIEVRTAYDWDPGTLVTGVPESAVLGVEARV